MLPADIIGDRYKGFVAYRPFCVTGHAYGGLIGPAGDVARLAFAHLNHGEAAGARILSSAATAAMQHIRRLGGQMDFGLGWFRRHNARPDFVEHLGGGSGFFSVMRLYSNRRLAIVLMGNTTRFDHERIIAAIVEAARLDRM